VPVRRADRWLVGVTIALVVIGVLMVFDASYAKAAESKHAGYDPFFYLKRHLVWAGLGWGAFVAGMRVGYWRLQRWSTSLLFVSVILLALVLVPGIGKVAGGARRWLQLGPLQLQPSELAKLALILYTASFVARNPRGIKVLGNGFARVLIPFAVVSLLILAEPDMGTTIATSIVFVAILYAGGAEKKHIWGLMFTGLVVGGALAVAEPYRLRRLLAFLNPWADMDGIGYQIVQGLFALGSGGLFGRGLGMSRFKWDHLPGEHTDYIFAIIGEEFGLFGTLAVLALFALLVRRGFLTAQKSRNNFGYLLALGLTLMVGVQAAMNLGVVTAVIPNTGVPLPMISFGGSSLILTLFALGVLADISRRPALPWDTEQYDNRSYRRWDRGAHLPGPEHRRGARPTRRQNSVYWQR
jgi:cell division protein FtsW